ncbi:MAG: glutamate synthase [Nitrososphaerota archaeon]|nr:glutamate synthase [Nitrososphaerota archaeon]
MDDLPVYDARYGQPVVKDGCGVFGVLRKKDAPRLSSTMAVTGLACVKYRGSGLGAGYASFDQRGTDRPYMVKAFVRDGRVAEDVGDRLSREIGPLEGARMVGGAGRMSVWQAMLRPEAGREAGLERVVDDINGGLLSEGRIDGRIFSYGRHVDVFKGVGHPLDVARTWSLDSARQDADLWLAHTREPTNSPGSFPIWSHPFASMDCAIVHNGDISSFGSNMDLLGSWGMKSHVGNDSEVIARLLDHLIRVEGLTVEQGATVMTSPYERRLSPADLRLLARFRHARLDGPFAVVAGYSDGKDTYLVALTDRSKFRPLLVGEDDHNFYVSSEENQIRSLSRDARVWAPEPGSFFMASLSRGLVEAGTRRGPAGGGCWGAASAPAEGSMDGSAVGFREINSAIRKASLEGKPGVRVVNANGQRYIGIGLSSEAPFRVEIEGFPGNCLANLNSGGTFEVRGNAADDLADTMHAGTVIVHGSARDVAGQALQGGSIFIRGSVGNRAAIQMREYGDRKPFMIVGETADDYLGEYMAGGVVVVLNLSDSPLPVLNYVGTGMVGGRIYVRGRVPPSHVGLPPHRDDVLNYLRAYVDDGTLPGESLEALSRLEFLGEKELSGGLPKELFSRVRFLFYSTKYTRSLDVETRRLNQEDRALLMPELGRFFDAFSVDPATRGMVLESEFDVITTRGEAPATPVPPQEVPVEE